MSAFDDRAHDEPRVDAWRDPRPTCAAGTKCAYWNRYSRNPMVLDASTLLCAEDLARAAVDLMESSPSGTVAQDRAQSLVIRLLEDERGAQLLDRITQEVNRAEDELMSAAGLRVGK